MKTGSYDPQDTFGSGLTDESDRLDAQALLSAPAELDTLAALGVPGRTIVEIGPGTGAFLAQLVERFPSHAVSGLELNPDLRRTALERGLDVTAGDAYALPYADASVDALVYRFVFQHLQDPERALAEARRVLRPGGAVFVIDVDASMWGAVEPCFAELASVQMKFAQAQHSRDGDRLVARRLSRTMRAVGFPQAVTTPYAVSTDTHDVQDFRPHLGPERLAPLVASGELSLADVMVATRAWDQLVAHEAPWVLLLGFVVCGRLALDDISDDNRSLSVRRDHR
ncbi:class I SAM-dependent methyltransferase [Luteipulveratus mongoliensis]|uniref:class I SAM-dependent methyltransferase n=1 Tax=Luteipulveratus mongoliensis TaxID=571913 RepID=UPI00069675E4|nr:class I SAM-dependent methyltransferase [Luteipulveratus mongoliensis]